MKKIIVIVCFMLMVPVIASAYTINDLVGDQIGVKQFDLYGINVIQDTTHITFDIYSNYPQNGVTVGSWKTFAGDLAFDFNNDGTYDHAVAFTNHDGLTAGGFYSVSSWNTSNNYALNGYTYNKNQIVTIKSGSFIEQADNFAWQNIAGTAPDYLWSVTLDKDLFPEGVNGIFYSVATCSNDNIKGSFTVTPEPATMLLFGMGVAGLAARLRRKNRSI